MEEDLASSFVLTGDPYIPLLPLVSGENLISTTLASNSTSDLRLPPVQTLSVHNSNLQLTPDSTQLMDFWCSHSPKRPRFAHSTVVPQSSELARRRRQRISDKMRALQKLMPGDTRMDTATTLEEARKYAKFLQAQIKALQSMSCVDQSGNKDDSRGNKGVFGELGMLNRQQLLEVLLNSAVGQTWLYSQGYCVFSVEQLAAIKEAVEREAVLERTMMAAGSRGCGRDCYQ